MAAAKPQLEPPTASPLLFVALVVGLSLPFWLAGWLADLEFLPGLPVSALMAVCPLLAALILAHRAGGVGAVTALLRRAIDAPRGPRSIWLLPAALLLPALFVVSTAIKVELPPSAAPLVGALPMVLVFLVAALIEELGWSGYATDPTQARLGALLAALAIGGVWAAWHVVPYLQAGRAWSWIAWQAAFSVGARVILLWIYNGGGRSVFVAALGHASINIAAFLLPAPGTAYDPQPAALATGLAAIAVALLWRHRKHARTAMTP